MRSGLVHLLDKLCSLANLRSDTSDTQSVNQKVSAMAWAGFQVLANRCVMWETEDGKLKIYFEQKRKNSFSCTFCLILGTKVSDFYLNQK